MLLFLTFLLNEDFELGKKLYRGGDYLLAIEAFNESLKKGGDSLEVLPYIAYSYLKMKDYDDCISYFEEYILKGGRERKVIEDYVDACIESGEPARAYLFLSKNNIYLDKEYKIKLAGSMYRDHPDMVLSLLEDVDGCDAGLIKCRAVSCMGRKYLAIELLKDLRMRCKDDEVLYELLRNYLDVGDTTSALILYEDIGKVKGIPYILAYRIGSLFMVLGDLERAIEFFRYSSDSIPDSSCMKLIQIYRKMGDYEKVIDLIEKVGDEYNLSLLRMKNIANIILKDKGDVFLVRPQDLINDYELKKVVEFSIDKGFYEKAEEFIQHIGEPERSWYRGLLAEKEGRYDDAIKFYRSFIKGKVIGDSIRMAYDRIFHIEHFVPKDTSVEKIFKLKTDMERGLYCMKVLKNYRLASSFFNSLEDERGRFYAGYCYEMLYRGTGDREFLERSLSKYREVVVNGESLKGEAYYRFLLVSLENGLLKDEGYVFDFLNLEKGDRADTVMYLASLRGFHKAESILLQRFPESELSHVVMYEYLKKRVLKGESTAVDTLNVLINSPIDSIRYLSKVLTFEYFERRDTLKAESLAVLLLGEALRNEDIVRIGGFIVRTENDTLILRMLSLLSSDVAPLYHLYVDGVWDKLYVSVNLKHNLNYDFEKDIFSFLKGVAYLKVKDRDGYLLKYLKKGIMKEKTFNILKGYYSKKEDYKGIVYVTEFMGKEKEMIDVFLKSLYLSGRIKEADSILNSFRDSLYLDTLKVYKFAYYVLKNSLKRAMNMYDSVKSYTICDLYYYSGLLFFKMRKYENAIKNFINYLKVTKDSTRLYSIYFKLGTMYYMLKEYDRSIDYYSKAALDERFKKDALQNIYVIYKRKGELQRSIDYLVELIGISDSPEERAEYEFKIGYTYFQLGRFPEALVSFRIARELYRDRDKLAEVTYWMGESYLAMGNFKKAAYEFTKVVELYGDVFMWRITSEMKIGMCYELIGDYDRAYSIYKKILKERGNDEWANLARQRILIIKKKGYIKEE